MVQYAESLHKLQELLKKEANEWTPGRLVISIATSLTNDNQIELDFSPTIGHRKNKPRNPSDDNCHWLPAHLNQNTEMFRVKTIHPIFVNTCHRAGFKIHGDWVDDEDCILFRCTRSRYHNEDTNKNYAEGRTRDVKNTSKPPLSRDNKTERPIKEDGEETCKFKFRVYWDEKRKRWFLPHQQRGLLQHCGHSHFQSECLRMKTKFLPEEEHKLAEDCFDTKNSATTTANLLNYRNDIGLEWHQLHYLKTKKKNDMVIRDLDPGNSSSGAQISAADRALAILHNDSRVSYTALTAEAKSGLISIRRRKKGVDNSITVEEVNENLDDGVDSPQSFALRELGMDEDELKSASASSKDGEAPKNLRLKNGQVLLALAWTMDESRRKFDMYPEIISGDATEKTNSEERPLYFLMGKDNMNKAFAHTWCFMPSNTRWAYTWFFQDAVPTLHPGTACERVKLILTDACQQEFHAIASVIGRGKVFANAYHRWCAWHRINRDFTNHTDFKSLLAQVRNSSIDNSVEVALIVRMMWYCIKHYETKEELELALVLIKEYLNEDQAEHKGDIDENARKKIREFFVKSFECNKHMLCEASFEEVMTCGNCTTGMSEGQNRAYKKSVHGTRPADDLAESTDKIIAMTQNSDARKIRSMTHAVKSKSAKASDRAKKAEGLSDYCNKLLLEEHAEGYKYLAYRPDECTFLIKRDYEKFDSDYSDDIDAAHTESEQLFDSMDKWIETQSTRTGKKALQGKKDELFGGGKPSMEPFKKLLCSEIRRVVPRFERTAVVEVRVIPGSENDEKMLVCNRCFKKRGLSCRHLYKLLDRHPKLTDAHVRWQTSYAQYYGVNGEMSKQFQALRDKIDLPGIPITDEELAVLNREYPVGYCQGHEEYFCRSLPGKLRLRGSRKNNHWKSTFASKSFVGVDRCCFACDDMTDESVTTAVEFDSSNLIGETVDRHSNQLVGVGTGPCGTSVIGGSSSYQVPSQMMEDESQDDFAFATSGSTGKRSSAYHNFMPLYQEASKLVDATGQEGHAILRKCLQTAAMEMRQIAHQNDGNQTTTGMRSGPKLSREKVAKRAKTACSPSK